MCGWTSFKWRHPCESLTLSLACKTRIKVRENTKWSMALLSLAPADRHDLWRYPSGHTAFESVDVRGFLWNVWRKTSEFDMPQWRKWNVLLQSSLRACNYDDASCIYRTAWLNSMNLRRTFGLHNKMRQTYGISMCELISCCPSWQLIGHPTSSSSQQYKAMYVPLQAHIACGTPNASISSP